MLIMCVHNVDPTPIQVCVSSNPYLYPYFEEYLEVESVGVCIHVSTMLTLLLPLNFLYYVINFSLPTLVK